MPVINIAGVLIHALPARSEAVARRLEEETGVEVHTVTGDGRLVVTVEKDTQKETGETLNRFQEIEHVISTSVIYQYFDDAVSEREARP